MEKKQRSAEPSVEKKQRSAEPSAEPTVEKKQRSTQPALEKDSELSETRPVARPLKAVREILAASAAEMKAAGKIKGRKPKCNDDDALPELPQPVRELDSDMEADGEPEPLTRREQLTLAPKAKAKSKAKGKAKSKAKAKAKPGLTDADGVPANPKQPAKKRKAAEVQLPADEGGMDGVDAEASSHDKGKGKVSGRGKGKDGTRGPANEAARTQLSPTAVMDILQQDDWMMQSVMACLDFKTAPEEIPTKDTPERLPAYDCWQLSVYWTRNTISLLHRNPKPPHRYCGNFTSGGSGNLAVALELIQDFAS